MDNQLRLETMLIRKVKGLVEMAYEFRALLDFQYHLESNTLVLALHKVCLIQAKNKYIEIESMEPL